MLDDKEYIIKANLYDGLECDDNIIFYQNDTRQSKIIVEFTGKKRASIDVSNCTVVCVIQKGDKEIVTAYMDNNNISNRAEYVLSQNALASIGKGTITIFVYDNDNGRQTFGSIKFKVLKDVNAEDIESTTDYPILTKLINDTRVVSLEAESVKEEILGVSADIANSEKKRVIAEEERSKNEIIRSEIFNLIKKEYGSLKRIIIDENQAANLQEQINKSNEQLDNNINKINFLDQLKCKFVYGINGDGTNETSKIQKFINDSVSGDILYFPKGNYVFDYLEVFNKPNLTIIGQDFKSAYTLNNFSTKFTSSYNLKPRIHVRDSVGFRIENIELKSKNTLNVTEMENYNTGIYLESSGQSVIQNCFIAGFNKGIELINSGVLKINRNHITHCCYGIYGKECGDSQYTDNYIYDIAFDFDEAKLKANVEFGSAICLAWAGNSKISGGKIEWNGKGILLRDTHGVIINSITFDYNRGFDIALDRTMQDYIYDKNRVREHIQTDGKYNTYDIKICNNTFLASGHFGSLSDTYYGSNIALYETNNIIINSNSFSFGSWQSYANEYGVTALKEDKTETIRQKSGPQVSFIRLRKAPQTNVTGNIFNSHYNTIPVLVNDLGNFITSCLYDNNISSASPVTNTTKNCFYRIDTEGRKEYSVGDSDLSRLKGSFAYMEKLDYFDGVMRVNKFCTKSGVKKNISSINGSNGENNLNCLYCSREITEEDFIIGDFIKVNGITKRIVGFYKPKDGGNHWIKLNSSFDSPVNAEILFEEPIFS